MFLKGLLIKVKAPWRWLGFPIQSLLGFVYGIWFLAAFSSLLDIEILLAIVLLIKYIYIETYVLHVSLFLRDLGWVNHFGDLMMLLDIALLNR